MQAAGGTAGASDMRSFGATVSLEESQRLNKTPPNFFCVIGKKSNHKTEKLKNSGKEKQNSTTRWRSPALSRLSVHELHLHIGGHATPIATLGLHLVLDGANRVHATEQVSRPYVSCVHEVRGLSNHTSVNPPAPFRLRLFCNTAVETQPEFTHA